MENTHVLKKGEVGSVLKFTLSDEDGPVNLDGQTVTVTARKNRETPVFADEPCVLAASQSGAGKGQGTYTFNSTTANIAINEDGYNLEFKAVQGSNVAYFPKGINPQYAILIVQESLD